jgi:hypothetical protein
VRAAKSAADVATDRLMGVCMERAIRF